MVVVLKKEPKTVTLKVRLEPTFKSEVQRFGLIHRVDMSDLVRIGLQRVMNSARRPKPLELRND